MLAIFSVCFVIACAKFSDGGDTIVTVAEPEIQVDTLMDTIVVVSRDPVRKVDLYIYPSDEPSLLEEHLVIDNEPLSATIKSVSKPGDKRILAIGNASVVPDDELMLRYESAERTLVTYHGTYDSRYRILSAATEFSIGRDSIIALQPLEAAITIRSISNMVGNYNRIENPSFHLERINAWTELFRQTGFYPVETLASSDTLALECDVGLFTQYPDKTLYCLPDESGSMSLVMECEINGVQCRFCNSPGGLKRGKRVLADYVIISSEDWSCTIYPIPRQ